MTRLKVAAVSDRWPTNRGRPGDRSLRMSHCAAVSRSSPNVVTDTQNGSLASGTTCGTPCVVLMRPTV